MLVIYNLFQTIGYYGFSSRVPQLLISQLPDADSRPGGRLRLFVEPVQRHLLRLHRRLPARQLRHHRRVQLYRRRHGRGVRRHRRFRAGGHQAAPRGDRELKATIADACSENQSRRSEKIMLGQNTGAQIRSISSRCAPAMQNPAPHLAPQHGRRMPERCVLRFKPALRPERQGEQRREEE